MHKSCIQMILSLTLALPGPAAEPERALALRLSIGDWCLSQGVQTRGQRVPLAAGRDGLLRVFVVASGTNRATPSLRATLRTPGRPEWTRVLGAPLEATPVFIEEGNLGATWNARVPGEELAPGSVLELELDPGRAYPGAHPQRVLARALDVRPAPPFRALLVPVAAGAGAPGGEGRPAAAWLDQARVLFPLPTGPGGEDLLVEPPFAAPAGLGQGAAGWGRLLLDLALKRLLDGEGRLVYGLVPAPEAGAQGGAALLGAGVAAGWDREGDRAGGGFAEVCAHGLGHALGLPHRPCASALADPGRGETGAYGFDLGSGTLVPPTLPDIMTSCRPAWAGPATVQGILEARRSAPGAPARARCLLVSGRVTGEGVDLDPAFTLDAFPGGTGGETWRLEALDAQDGLLAAAGFTPAPLADLDPAGAAFALALPLAGVREEALAALRILKDGREVARRTRTGNPGPAQPWILGSDGGRMGLRWEPRDAPAALVRHGATGRMLGRGEGGSLDFRMEGWEARVDLSDGVTSRTFRVNGMLP